MSEKYVIVHRSYDPVQTDMLGDILRENGIHARVLGTRHGAVIGVGPNILQMHIEVPRSQAGPATDFLEAFFETDGAALLREHFDDDEDVEETADASDWHSDNTADDDDDRDDDVAADQRRRPLFAAGISLILGAVGGGHLYARRPWTALVLAMGQLYALSLLFSDEWATVATGLLAFASLVLCDLAGSQWAVHAHNRGGRAQAGQQVLTGLAMVVVAGVISSFVGPHVPEPDTDNDRQRSEWAEPAY